MTDCHYFLLCKKNVSWHILAPGARSLATIFIFSRMYLFSQEVPLESSMKKALCHSPFSMTQRQDVHVLFVVDDLSEISL